MRLNERALICQAWHRCEAERTYTRGPADTQATGDPRLDNNRFFHERIQTDVENGLNARGFEKTTAGSPDVLIHYHASVTQTFNANGADQPYVTCDDCEPYVYDAGTIVVDLVDARTRRLVWRGWAEGALTAPSMTSVDGKADRRRGGADPGASSAPALEEQQGTRSWTPSSAGIRLAGPAFCCADWRRYSSCSWRVPPVTFSRRRNSRHPSSLSRWPAVIPSSVLRALPRNGGPR
jgi:hypothetical protein